MIRCVFKGELVRRIGLLLASGYLCSNGLAVEIAVPSPKEMIIKSDIIAVGHLEMSDDSVVFIANGVLKGAIDVGKQYILRSPFPAESFSEKQLLSVTRGEQFMLVARWNNDHKDVRPIYGLCSAWPQGTTAELLPQRTLADCIALVHATLPSESTPNATAYGATPKTPVNSTTGVVHNTSGMPPMQFDSSPAPTRAPTTATARSVNWVIWIVVALVILLAAGLLLRFGSRRE